MDYSLLVGIHDVEKAEQELNNSLESEENGVDEDDDSTCSVGQVGAATPPDSPLCPMPPLIPAFTGEIDPEFELFAVKCSEGKLFFTSAMDPEFEPLVIMCSTGKGENPFMRMRSICVTYAVCKYVTFRTFNVLNVFAAVQRMKAGLFNNII